MLFRPMPTDTCVGGPSTPFIEVSGVWQGRAVKTEVSSCYEEPVATALWLAQLPRPPLPGSKSSQASGS